MKTSIVIALTVCVAGVARAQQPLCVIDGVRHPTSDCPGVVKAAVDAKNIDHIEIVKGPTAVAQYGADAANGVIIVTTKMGAGRPLAGDDPLARYLFPPELVMAHQQEISLTDRQQAAIQLAMKEAQGKFIDLQFQMSGVVEKLQRLVQPTSADEAKVLEQVDRVLTVEREIKHAQLTLMIRIKNQLTEQQQTALGKLRP
jgi:TonB-dependent SusC/RagA subfamily outer membrane receptor